MSNPAFVLKEFRGWNSRYADIAARGDNEALAVAVEYAIHPSNVGCLIVRFVVHGEGAAPGNYKHLTFRESAKFVIPPSEENPHSQTFKALRLNKVAIPVFKPAVKRHEVEPYAEQFGTWVSLAAWIAEQVTAEGFTLLLAPEALVALLRERIVGTPTGEVQNVLELPDLTAPAQQASALKAVVKPEPDSDEDEEDEEEEDDDTPDWLN